MFYRINTKAADIWFRKRHSSRSSFCGLQVSPARGHVEIAMTSDSSPRWRAQARPRHRHTAYPPLCLSLLCFHLWNEGGNTISIVKSLPGLMDSKHGSGSKASACNAGRDPGSSLGREDSRSRKWQPPPADLPGEPHGQRSLEVYSPWGHKSQTQLSTSHTHTIPRTVPGIW